jgi:hypothetical protein
VSVAFCFDAKSSSPLASGGENLCSGIHRKRREEDLASIAWSFFSESDLVENTSATVVVVHRFVFSSGFGSAEVVLPCSLCGCEKEINIGGGFLVLLRRLLREFESAYDVCCC